MNTTNAFPKTIYAIQHLAFEDLGSLEDVFYQLGFRVRYFEAGVDDLTPAFTHDGLTIILGGPIGVYETEDYPFSLYTTNFTEPLSYQDSAFLKLPKFP